MSKIELSDFPKVTVILRGYNYEQVRCIVSQLVGTRVNAIEVAMNTDGAAQTIAKIAQEFGDELLVGAGTVISKERAHAAAEAGARFALSPICFTEEIFEICKDAEMFCVPAACSPTEVWTMLEMGADIVKVYPATTLGPNYFTQIQAPLNKMPLMAVGGVNPTNCQAFFDAGASYVGMGNGIFKHEDIIALDERALKASVEELEKIIRW